MERMNCSILVLDACTIINLLHIDENNMLFEELIKHKIYIAEEVISEVKRNANNKFQLLDSYKVTYEKDKVEEIKENVSFLIRYKVGNNEIEKDCGNFFNDVKRFANYNKRNGEFLSSCLALLKSREENHLVNFYSDDYPATRTFQNLFDYQKIGFIQDSVDLLLYLFWTSSKISKKYLQNFVSLLLYEYSIELKLLLDQVRKRKSTIQKLRKDKKIINLLYRLENSLETINLKGINQIREELFQKRRNYPDLYNLLESFSKIFELENREGQDLFTKLKNTKEWLNKFEVLKLN